MKIQRILLGLTLAAVAAIALALDRPFPPVAKRGTMTPAVHPQIIINGHARRMSAGGRIWNRDNLIQMPGSIRGHDLVVNYTENFQGDIDRIWILTAKEAEQTPAEQKITDTR